MKQSPKGRLRVRLVQISIEINIEMSRNAPPCHVLGRGGPEGHADPHGFGKPLQLGNTQLSALGTDREIGDSLRIPLRW
jgi:hypothetical protein